MLFFRVKIDDVVTDGKLSVTEDNTLNQKSITSLSRTTTVNG
jgi:hypothetical protein